jgi:ferritin
MINKKVETAMIKQIEIEGFSSQLYLSMASWCDVNGYAGAAKFLYQQTEEERFHMLKFIHHINERGGHAIISALKKPDHQFKSINNIFEQVQKHEQFVTDSINKIMDVCNSEKDYTSANFLQWYVNEQIEEEATAQTILDKIKLLGKDKEASFFMMDKELEVMAAAKIAAFAATTAANAKV